MHFIQVHFTSNRVIFSSMTPDQIGHYLFSFFNEEQKAALEADLQFCVDNAWLHPISDNEFYTGLGKQMFSIDPTTNKLTITYIAHHIEQLCEHLFDPPKVGINPAKDYLDTHPDEGTYNLSIFDSNGNDVTSQYSKL